MKKAKTLEMPELDMLEDEYKRITHKQRYISVFKNTVFTLITVAAISVLIATLWLPVLRIYGSSMAPTMNDGNIVVSIKNSDYTTGDVIAFYYNNKILVKRVIAKSGDWINIDRDGVVYVNGSKIDEPYVTELALGECDIELPYQVPDERVFVMGDHRSVSVDSRSTAVGCVAEEQVVGIISYKLWPFEEIGKIESEY